MKYKVKTVLSEKLYASYKKILFKQDAEKVHERFLKLGEKFGSSKVYKKILSALFNYKNKKLKQKILGIDFENPVGLAAGFDYEAQLTQVLPAVGFGFNTIGSITLDKYEGNNPPRLARLPKSKSILVNKGLKSTGARSVIKFLKRTLNYRIFSKFSKRTLQENSIMQSSLKRKKFTIPLGISIAKTNCKKTASDKNGIKDYISSLKLWEKSRIGDYYEINISCPNAFGGEPFTTPEKLSNLFKEIDKLKISKPIFLKMPVDFSTEKTKSLCEVAKEHNVQGLIFGNLTKNRSNKSFNREEIKKVKSLKGNFSGIPTKDLSNKLIKFAYKNYKNRFIIVGCGGIFSAEDAYEKIKLGASLVQLITGMIYRGPSLIGEINQGLVQLLEKDHYKNIEEAIGKYQ